MEPMEQLDQLLSTVGLLRAKFSQIMKTIHDTRQECKQRMVHPPEDLSPLMGRAQELFAELLKAGEFLGTTRENLLRGRTPVFEGYLEDWVLSQTEERFQAVRVYLEELSRTRIAGFHPDPEIWEEGLMLIEKSLSRKT